MKNKKCKWNMDSYPVAGSSWPFTSVRSASYLAFSQPIHTQQCCPTFLTTTTQEPTCNKQAGPGPLDSPNSLEYSAHITFSTFLSIFANLQWVVNNLYSKLNTDSFIEQSNSLVARACGPHVAWRQDPVTRLRIITNAYSIPVFSHTVLGK